jgi:hypothetical protein
MDKELTDKLGKLESGQIIKINGKNFTIKEKTSSKAPDKHGSDTIRYALGDDFVLEHDWDWKFFQCITKKGLLGTTITTAKLIEIKDIEIV